MIKAADEVVEHRLHPRLPRHGPPAPEDRGLPCGGKGSGSLAPGYRQYACVVEADTKDPPPSHSAVPVQLQAFTPGLAPSQ